MCACVRVSARARECAWVTWDSSAPKLTEAHRKCHLNNLKNRYLIVSRFAELIWILNFTANGVFVRRANASRNILKPFWGFSPTIRLTFVSLWNLLWFNCSAGATITRRNKHKEVCQAEWVRGAIWEIIKTNNLFTGGVQNSQAFHSAGFLM